MCITPTAPPVGRKHIAILKLKGVPVVPSAALPEAMILWVAVNVTVAVGPAKTKDEPSVNDGIEEFQRAVVIMPLGPCGPCGPVGPCGPPGP